MTVEYRFVISDATLQAAENYLRTLKVKKKKPGPYLKEKLKSINLANIDIETFLELLVNTKLPKIYAESDAYSDSKTQWNEEEFALLGDIGCAVPVQIFDQGRWKDLTEDEIHTEPFFGTLLFVPGALLAKSPARSQDEASRIRTDRAKVINENNGIPIFNKEAYYQLYENRLLPSLLYANSIAANKGKKAFITIPGMGCGVFSGEFDDIAAEFKAILEKLLEKHADKLGHIQAVYFDPNDKLANERKQLGNSHKIELLVRPLKDNDKKTQLCHPGKYQEEGDNFKDCEFFSFVAWDHVSWPGNDFYAGSRWTDDGVKAAATDSMYKLTGIEGSYNPKYYEYNPPTNYDNWEKVVTKKQLQLQVSKNTLIADLTDGIVETIHTKNIKLNIANLIIYLQQKATQKDSETFTAKFEFFNAINLLLDQAVNYMSKAPGKNLDLELLQLREILSRYNSVENKSLRKGSGTFKPLFRAICEQLKIILSNPTIPFQKSFFIYQQDIDGLHIIYNNKTKIEFDASSPTIQSNRLSDILDEMKANLNKNPTKKSNFWEKTSNSEKEQTLFDELKDLLNSFNIEQITERDCKKLLALTKALTYESQQFSIQYKTIAGIIENMQEENLKHELQAYKSTVSVDWPIFK
jgi:hypothetical protein